MSCEKTFLGKLTVCDLTVRNRFNGPEGSGADGKEGPTGAEGPTGPEGPIGPATALITPFYPFPTINRVSGSAFVLPAGPSTGTIWITFSVPGNTTIDAIQAMSGPNTLFGGSETRFGLYRGSFANHTLVARSDSTNFSLEKTFIPEVGENLSFSAGEQAIVAFTWTLAAGSLSVSLFNVPGQPADTSLARTDPAYWGSGAWAPIPDPGIATTDRITLNFA